jgi:hypothetical protein
MFQRFPGVIIPSIPIPADTVSQFTVRPLAHTENPFNQILGFTFRVSCLISFFVGACIIRGTNRTRVGRNQRLRANLSQRSRGRGDTIGGNSNLLLALLDLKGATVRFENAVWSVYLCIQLGFVPVAWTSFRTYTQDPARNSLFFSRTER